MATGGLKLLFDEMFSHRHVTFVEHESHLGELQHMRDIGWSGEKDRIWIPHAVAAGFVIVTNDRNDRTRKYTVADLKSLNARVLLIGRFWDHMNGWERAKWLVNSVERIVMRASELEDGSVSLLDRRCNPKPQ